ncbi:MAG: lamin tail domain-containing protein [Pirellulales bacterium]|nr:lamin tail domain-containing protein [Pirellulales bacterium]
MLRGFAKKVSGASQTLFRRKAQGSGSRIASDHRLAYEPLEPRLVLDAGPLIISEFLAVNDFGYDDNGDYLGLADGDNNSSDWIEIHNPTDTTVNLNGWYLTDDRMNLTRWQFPTSPSTSLDPGDYLVVFASDGRSQVENPANPYLDSAGYLHTNFQLDGGGEYLALVLPNGVTVSHEYVPEYPNQHTNVSYGITQHISTFVPERAEMSYRVPTSSDAGENWTSRTYDDSDWTDDIGTGDSGLRITEIDNGGTDWLEIQNLWNREIDTAGWLVAVNNGTTGNVNSVNATVWTLPDTMAAGQVLYKTDSPTDHYWGRDIAWDSTRGWVMIVDGQGQVADFLPWGYTEAQIQSLNVSVGGFSNVQVGSQWSGVSPSGMTNGWQTSNPSTDIGDPGWTGSSSYNAGSDTHTVEGSGNDIWDRYDRFHYVYQTMTGDSEVVAKVLSVENTNSWAKAGVMIRETLNADSKHAMTVVTPGNGVSFQYRTATGDVSGHSTQAGYSAPYWVKLVREGNEFRGYRSEDGANWYLVGSQTITMNATVYVGLAVTSHDDSTLCTAEFSDVAVGVPAPPSKLERVGSLDRNMAGDFALPEVQSKGFQNADLVLPFPGSESTPVTTGVGFNLNPTGLNVTVIKAKDGVTIDSLAAAESLIADPGQQEWIEAEIAETINYFNTGSDGHYGGNVPYPGTVIGTDTDNFVIEVTATVLIPSAGEWTFGVNSDDGFGLTLTNGVDMFSVSYPGPRGPGDTFGVFNVTDPGSYDMRLVVYEQGGGAEAELFAAPGSHDTFNADAFDLVGDMANGGLLVTGFGGAVQTNVEEEMHGQNASLWMRIPFEVEDPSTLNSLQLQMKYNDGYIAYLNGQEVARRNFTGIAQWNSHATTQRTYEQSAVYESVNVTAYVHRLIPGTNVLAIQGMNYSASDDDFLILPMLVGTHTGDVQRFFTEPSPGEANGAGYIDFVEDTQFSVDRGFFQEPFQLEITTSTPGATIRYTTDGSTPTETNGAVYSGPLTINKTTVLRAAAFKTDYYPTNTDTQTYLFLSDVVTQSPNGEAPAGWPAGSVNGQSMEYGMDPAIVNDSTWGPQMLDALTAIPTMSLVTDLDNLLDPGSGIYVNAYGDGIDWERPASLELIYPDNPQGPGFPDGIEVDDGQGGLRLEFPGGMQEGFQIDMGLRIRGGYSRSGGNPKHAFRFFFRNEYGAGKLNYPLFGDTGVDSFDKVDLRTSQNYSWSYANDSANAMCRDVWARDSQGQADQPYTRSRYYHLYIDGQYWGLYQTQERAEAAYGESYFGGDRDEYDTIKVTDGYNIHATDGTIDAWRQVWDLANLGFETDAKYHYIQGQNPDGTRNPGYPALIDVDNLIDYMIQVFYDGDRDAPISNFLGNESPNNWYGVRNRNGEEGFKFFVHDAEHIMSRGLDDRTGPFPAGDTFEKSNPQWVHQKMMDNPDYRLRFADRAHERLLNDGLLTTANAIARFQERVAQIDMAIIAESARWGSSSLNKSTWQNTINYEINSFFPGRAERILEQLKVTRLRNGTLAPLYPGVDAPAFSQHGGQVPSGFDLAMFSLGSTTYQDTVVVPEFTQAKYLVPTNNNLGTTWTAWGFSDASWSSGTTGFGYEDSPADYSGLITTRVRPAETDPGATSILVRKTFTVDDLGDIDRLTLRMKYDDGYVAYLNGQEVARRNVSGTPAWNSSASNHPDDQAVVFEDVDISDHIDKLVPGSHNVLAIHAINTSAGSSDMLISPELVVRKLVFDPDGPDIYYTTDGSDPRSSAGTPSTSAVLYGGSPITLLQSHLIQARTYQGGQWSALNKAHFYVDQQATAENLVISEINYHPYDPTPAEIASGHTDADDFEFIELKNVSGDTIDLTGAEFTFGIEFDFDDADVLTLAPGEYVVVVANEAAFAQRYDTAGMLIAGQYTGTLDNGGERVMLMDWTGERIHSFEYNDSGNWPGRADGGGSSLELIDPAAVPHTRPERPTYLEDGDHWRSSAEYGGSPGTAGSGPVGDVVVNEVLSHTDPPLTDTIELHNTTGNPIDVGGWYLSDSNGNYLKFRVPDGTTIAADGYIVFDEDDFNPTPLTPGPNDFALDGAHGDDVWLLEADAAGKPMRFVDHVDFPAAANGESFGRWPNGTGDLYPMITRTLDPADGANSGPRVGPVVISEIHYNPSVAFDDDALEFVEIYNPTVATVDLTGWRIRKGIDFDFAAGTELAPHTALVIVPFDLGDTDKLVAFRTAYGIDASVPLVGGYAQKLDDGGERVQLQRPDAPPANEPWFTPYLVEDEVRYDDQLPWPAEADGGGLSLNRAGKELWGDGAGNWTPAVPTPGEAPLLAASGVAGRYVFYNCSAFDGNNASANVADDDAIAVDKTALLPGETATFANYTCYSRGINGIMIDIEGLPTFAALGSDDFEFRVGNSNTPSTWAVAADPSLISVRSGAGIGGSDRVTLIWPDYAIARQWLQVTMLPTDDTALDAADVFYFGNAVGEAGNSTLDAKVNASDMLLARNNPRNFLNPAPVDFHYDFNRDARVNATDMLIARNNQTHFLNALKLITVPGTKVAVGKASFRDAVLSPAGKQDAADRDASPAESDWVYAIEELTAGGQHSGKDSSKEATDQILATYGI